MSSIKSENIVLIIGNGFDKAQGLETTYREFTNYLFSIINQEIDTILFKSYFNYSFISDSAKDYILSNPQNRKEVKTQNKSDYIQLIDQMEGMNTFPRKELIENWFKTKNISNFLKNRFLEDLLKTSHENWFDIERFYFNQLVKVIPDKIKQEYLGDDKIKMRDVYSEVRRLQLEFEEVKKLLREYLGLQLSNHKGTNRMQEFFMETIPSLISTKPSEVSYGKNSQLYIVDFNYTKTILPYIKDLTDKYSNLILTKHWTIHGDLDSKRIIFGYGDDSNEAYHKMKNIEPESLSNEFLTNIKTYQYMDNSDYAEAIGLFNHSSQSKYDVWVLGHSLGKTDKTLLKEIFNSSICHKIRLFKREPYTDLELASIDWPRERFNDLKYAICRIMDDDALARKKVISYEDSVSFP